jgi:hypothetical protein
LRWEIPWAEQPTGLRCWSLPVHSYSLDVKPVSLKIFNGVLGLKFCKCSYHWALVRDVFLSSP